MWILTIVGAAWSDRNASHGCPWVDAGLRYTMGQAMSRGAPKPFNRKLPGHSLRHKNQAPQGPWLTFRI